MSICCCCPMCAISASDCSGWQAALVGRCAARAVPRWQAARVGGAQLMRLPAWQQASATRQQGCIALAPRPEKRGLPRARAATAAARVERSEGGRREVGGRSEGGRREVGGRSAGGRRSGGRSPPSAPTGSAAAPRACAAWPGSRSAASRAP
eukprot:1480447-Prymnesium_polylepis.1